MKLIYRDDYISKDTPVDLIKFTHNQFLIHHLTHTISVICNGLEKNQSLINFINKTHNLDICIHGWDLKNYSLATKQEIEDDLDKCILKIEDLFGVTPEKWYLPWNGWTKDDGFDLVPKVADLAIYHGVDVDIDCDHISDAIARLESKQKLVTGTIYFNSYLREDLEMLPNLLYLTRKPSCKL